MNANDQRSLKPPCVFMEPTRAQAVLTRRQTLLTLGTILGGGLFAKSVYADLINNLLGGSGKTLIDKSVNPSSGLIVADGGSGSDKYTMHTLGLPDHATGAFPNEGCPGAIGAVAHLFQIPKVPKIANKVTPLGHLLFGVAVNGVAFDQIGPYWQEKESTGWHYEVMSTIARVYLGLDFSNAHTQTSGEYHYHGNPLALQSALEKLKVARGDKSRFTLLGFAADGFPVYAPQVPRDPSDSASPIVELKSSYRLLSGSSRGANAPPGPFDGSFEQDYVYVPGLGDLDECNGRFGATDEYPDGTYYYVATYQYPFLPRFYRGTPDPTFDMGRSNAIAPVPPGLTKIFG